VVEAKMIEQFLAKEEHE